MSDDEHIEHVIDSPGLTKANTDEELRALCERYAEGNIDLERLLYALNKTGLTTFASCKGEEDSECFVSFRVLPKDEKKIISILSLFLHEEGITISISPHKYLFNGIAVYVGCSPDKSTSFLKNFLDNIIMFPKETDEIVEDIFKLCHLEEQIADDLSFGIRLTNVNGRFNVRTSGMLSYVSLKRQVSIASLEYTINRLSWLSTFITGRSKSSKVILSALAFTLEDLTKVLLNGDMKLVDYYPHLSMQELVELMNTHHVKPGLLSNLMDLIKSDETDTLEREDVRSYLDHYIEILKMEESLEVKKISLTNQVK